MTTLGRGIAGYARWITTHPWKILFAALLIGGLAATGLPRLKLNDDYRAFFDADNPQLVAYTELQNTFTKNDFIIFALQPANGDVFAADTLAAIDMLTTEAWKLPYSIRVDSLTNFPFVHAEGDEIIIEDIGHNLHHLSPEDLTRRKEVALKDPRLVHALVSPSAHVAGVIVTYQLSDDARTEEPLTVVDARELAGRFGQAHPDITVYLTGTLMLNNAFREAVMKDLMTLFPLMYVVIFLMMTFLLRSLLYAFATLLVVLISVAMGMGIAGWIGFEITAPSASTPTLIMTLAVADCIHLFSRFLEELRAGADKRAALEKSLRSNMVPVFLTTITTIIGFLTINFSDSPPFRDLGNMGAMGVAAAFLFAVTLLPALIMVLPLRIKPHPKPSGKYLSTLADFVIAKQRVLLPLITAVVVLSAAFIPLNELNDHYSMYFDESIQFRTDVDFTNENLTGMYQIEYALDSGVENGICNPAYLEDLESFAKWASAQPGVVHIRTFSDTMKQLNRVLHSEDPNYYKLPDDRALASQALLLYEMSLPFGLDLNHQINVSKSSTRFVVTTGGITVNELSALAEAGEEWLKENVDPALFSHGMGPAVMFSKITEHNIEGMLGGTLVALVMISGVLLLSFGSVKIGIISLVPNLVPAAVAFGMWGLFVGKIGLGLSAVAAMTLGIVVDDTVHFLNAYLSARRGKQLTSADSVRHALTHTGRSLISTTAILVSGFLVLSVSSFKVNASMGILISMVLLSALVADLLLLPTLLLKLDRERD